MSKDAKHFSDGMRWNRRDPERNSLWLLPSGPDQIGEASARAGSEAYIGDRSGERKAGQSWNPHLHVMARLVRATHELG